MPTLASGVAMMTWQHPSSAALPAKHRPDTTPTRGTRPLERAEEREGLRVESGHDGHVGVARPAAAALGEQDDRQPEPLHELEEAVLLAVVHLALGAGQDGVVVRQHGAAIAVDATDAGDEAVGGRVGDEVLGAAARPLGGDDEPAVLLEAPGVAQVVDVLPRRPPAGPVAALGGGGTPGVERGGDARPQLGQLGPDTRGGRVGGGGRWRHVDLRRGDADEDVPGLHGIAGAHQDRVDDARRGGLDHVLHLHGLEHDEDGAGGDPVARPHDHPGDGAGEGHGEVGQAVHRGVGTSKPTGESQLLREATSWTGRRGATAQVPVG